MRVTELTYEAYYLDFLEGNLSEELTKELMQFLKEKPHLKLDEDFELHKLDVPKVRIPEKKFLKREYNLELSNEEFEDLCIKSVEGIVTLGEAALLEELTQNDHVLKLEYQTFLNTKLGSPNIVFENKETLKKRNVSLFTVWTAVAAVLILALIITVGLFKDNTPVEINTTPVVAVELPEEYIHEKEVEKEDTFQSKTPALALIEDVLIPVKSNKKEEKSNIASTEPKTATTLQEPVVVKVKTVEKENKKINFTPKQIEDTPVLVLNSPKQVVDKEEVKIEAKSPAKSNQKAQSKTTETKNSGVFAFVKRVTSKVSKNKIDIDFKENEKERYFALGLANSFSITNRKTKK